jgi:hypothetical protein
VNLRRSFDSRSRCRFVDEFALHPKERLSGAGGSKNEPCRPDWVKGSKGGLRVPQAVALASAAPSREGEGLPKKSL